MRYLIHQGYDCVPVNPNARDVLGLPTFRSVIEAVAETGPVDIVDVFRRSELCLPHAEEAVAVGARCLWLQLGVVDWEAARIAAAGGLGGGDGPLHRDRAPSGPRPGLIAPAADRPPRGAPAARLSPPAGGPGPVRSRPAWGSRTHHVRGSTA